MISFLGDFDLAEDVVQEAFASAAERWSRAGDARNPGAWLVTAARHRAIDRIRRDRTLSSKLALLVQTSASEEEQQVPEAFRVPPTELLSERLAAVLAVVYLIYNEGYAGRVDLANEAIRLGRIMAELMPDQPEVHGLLALVLCHDTRRRARYASDELVLLEAQD